MAENDKVARVLLSYEIQKQKLAELRAANQAIQKDVDALGTTTAKAGDKVRSLSERFSEFRERGKAARDESSKLRAEMLGLDTSIKDTNTDSVSLAGNLAKVREELQKTQDTAKDGIQPRDSKGRFLPKIRGSSDSGDDSDLLDELLGTTGTGSASGGKRNTFGLRSGGRELKALPAVQIPGLPISTDAIGKISQLLGALSATAVVAGGAIAGLGFVLTALTAQAKAAKEAADGELASRRRAIELITTGSKEDIQARINELDAKRKANKEAADNANAFLVNLRSDTVREFGLAKATISEINATLGTGAGELSAAKDNADKANKSLNETSTELQLLQQASGLTVQSTDVLIQKEKELANARKQLTVINENASDIQQITDLEATGTNVQAVQDLADAKRREIKVNEYAQQASLDYAKTLKEGSAEYIEAIAQADKYHDAIERDRNFIARLSQGTFELVGARQKELETLSATKKFNDDRVKSTDDYLAKITDISTKNAEKLVDLANKKADAEEAALQKITDKIASLDLAGQRAVEDANIKAQRAELDAAEKAQREIAKSARAHADNLVKIQQEANDKADDLIAKRDFTGLLRLRQDTTKQLQTENDKYSTSEQERATALEQEHDDRLKAYARDAEDRRTKYNRDLQDANTQYRRELSDAANKYNKALTLQQAAGQAELTLAQNKYNAQQQLLQQSIQNELLLINQGNVARAQLQTAANNQLLAQAQQLLQAAYSAAGIVTATNGISANTNNVNNNNSRVVNAPINITGGRPTDIGKAVRTQLAYLIG